MIRFFYDRIPPGVLILALLLGWYFWGWLKSRFRDTHKVAWKLTHAALCLCWLALFAYVTGFSRESSGVSQVILRPFWSYRLAFLEGSYDYFQEIYLNILLFIPFGAALGEVFPRRGWIGAILLCLLVSIAGEYVQYTFALGLAETDDVISNTLGGTIGVILGAFGVPAYNKIHKAVSQWLKND